MIHFITPLYRLNNLKVVYSSIIHHTTNFSWHLIQGTNVIGCEDIEMLKRDDRIKFYEIKTNFTWGHEQRNFFIKNIVVPDQDWCYFLDDDNIVTNDLVHECETHFNSETDVILFSQKKGLTEEIRLYGLPGNLKLGACDIGSFVLRYKILKQTYALEEAHRNSDGNYCQYLNQFDNGNNFKFLVDKFVRYNSLSLEIA